MKKLILLAVLLITALGGAEDLIPSGPESKPKEWMIGPWKKLARPIMKPNSRAEAVDSRNVYNMATILEDGVVRMIYRAESLSEPAKSMTGRLCLAQSKDGRHFTRWPESSDPKPVLVPTEAYERMGVEDPRLVKIEDRYYLTYSAWDGKTARLCLATSTDLIKWEKHGPLFPDYAPTNGWTKSGSILPERLKSGPYKGKYIMYFGDTHIWMASSDDLIHWKANETPVFSPREGKFDNVLVEPGPPAMRTEQGILLIYNGAGKFSETGDKLIYASGQILLDGEDPSKVKDRCEKPFLSVTQAWEEEGYVDNVVFAEGLVKMGEQWLLYYGGGDRVIGLGVAPVK